MKISIHRGKEFLHHLSSTFFEFSSSLLLEYTAVYIWFGTSGFEHHGRGPLLFCQTGKTRSSEQLTKQALELV